MLRKAFHTQRLERNFQIAIALLITVRIVSSLAPLQFLRATVFVDLMWSGHACKLEICHFKEQKY